MITLHISFRVASLALGQSYDCPSASEGTLKDMDKSHQNFNTTKPNKFVNHIHNSQPPLYNILMAWLHGINFTGSSYHYMWEIPFRRFIIKEKHVTLGIMCHALIHLFFAIFVWQLAFSWLFVLSYYVHHLPKLEHSIYSGKIQLIKKLPWKHNWKLLNGIYDIQFSWYTSQVVAKILNNIINVS